MINRAGKVLTNVTDLVKVLENAQYKVENIDGSHRKFVGQYNKLTLFGHDSQSYEVEVLLVLKKLLDTSEHWLKEIPQ